MRRAEECGLEAYPIESHEMYDDMYKQRNAYVKGYEKGYQEALAHIKSEVAQKIADKENMNRKTSIELSKDGKSSMYILTKIDSEGFHHSIFVSKEELVEILKLINNVTI